MSKCIKCGRELTSAEIPEFYNGMCEKCYKEQNCAEYLFKQGIYDYQNLIEQLKQQLEEKDKLIEFGKEEIRKRNKRIDEIVERDRKLFEDKNNEIESLNKRVNRYENMFRSRINRTGDMQKDIELYINQLAINELAEVERLLYESHYREIDCKYYAEMEDIERLIDNRIKWLQGEKDVED